MRNLRRAMSLLLCSAMLSGLLTTAAFAQEPLPSTLTHSDLFEAEEMLDFGTQGTTSRHTHGLTLTEMPRGDLFAVWFSSNPSGERDANECRLIGAWLPRSEIGKENAQWSDPFEVYNLDGVPSNNPVAYVDGNGRLWVFFNVILNGQWVSAIPRYIYADPGSYESAIKAGTNPDWHYPEQMYVNVGDSYGGQGTWNGSEYTYAEKGDRIRHITQEQFESNPLPEGEYVKVTSRFSEDDVRYITDSFVVAIDNQVDAAVEYLETYKPYDDEFGQRNDIVLQSVNEGIFSAAPYKSEPSLRDGAIWRASGADNDLKTWNPAFRRMGWQTKNAPIEFTLPAGQTMSNGEISDGTAVRMLLPLYSDSLALSICAYTDDYGKTWAYSDPIAGLGNIQGNLVMREDGVLYQYFRSGKLDGKNGRLDWKITRSESHDYGVTWENIYVEPYLRNDGGMGLDVTADGDWIMVHNQDTKADLRTGCRNSVTLSMSKDEGETWQSIMLDTAAKSDGSFTGMDYQYPGVICTQDGWIVVAYTNGGRGGPSQVMRSTMFKESDLDALMEMDLNVADTAEIQVGATQDFDPVLTYQGSPVTVAADDLVFRTTDASVATVDQNGVVSGVSEGRVKILVSSKSYGTLDECLVTVSSSPVGTVYDLGSDVLAPVQDNGDLGDHLHGSTIVQFADGELMAAWFQGNGERDATTTRIMAARKPAGSEAWGEPFVLADTPRMADINPALFVDHENNLWLFWYPVLGGRWESSQPKYLKAAQGSYESANGFTGCPDWEWQDAIYVRVGGNFSGGADDLESERVDPGITNGTYNDPYTQLLNEKYAELKEYMFASIEDGGAGVSELFFGQDYEDFVQERLDLSLGKLYSAKENVPYARRIGWQTKDKPLEIQYNGGWRIILPLYSDTMECTIMAISDDGGETWQFSEPVIGVANIQASMAQKEDGTIVAYMRDNGVIPKRVVVAESTDGGMTWTIGKDHQDLFDPGVGSDLVELPNGNWVFVNNDNQFGRFSLAVALSEDEGQTWSYRRHIALDTRATARSFHYPAVTVGTDGKIYISYTVDYSGGDGELAGYNHIKYICIDEDWIKAGDAEKEIYSYDVIVHAADGSGLDPANIDLEQLKALLPATVKGFYTYTEALEDGKTDYVDLPILWSEEKLQEIKAALEQGRFDEGLEVSYTIDTANLPEGVTVDMLPEQQPAMLLMITSGTV